MRAKIGCCIFSLLHHILGALPLALLLITATMATPPTLRSAKSCTSWSKSFFPPVKAPAMGFMAANGGMARRYWMTKGLGVGRRLLMKSDANTSGFSGAGSAASSDHRNAGSIQGSAEAGDEVFRTGLPPLHWPSAGAEPVSGNPGADQSSAPAHPVNLGKNNKRKGASSLPPIKGALPNKSKSTGPLASNVNAGTGEGAYVGDISSSSSSSSSREKTNVNAYPLHARAAVAVTIATRPSAFEKTTRYCVVKRSKEPGKGKWSLPGGSVELGEETLLAAAREAREETSLSKEDLRFFPHAVCTTDAIYRREDGTRGILFHYVITHQAAWITTGAMDRARAGDDAAELTFKTLEELKAMSLEGLLVGNVCDVVMRVERLVAKGVINIEFDLVRLEA